MNETKQHLVLQELTKVNVYIKDMTIISIEEEPMMQPFDLFSDIGGILGLFVGMSLLSLCEIVQLVCELVAGVVSKLELAQTKKLAPVVK